MYRAIMTDHDTNLMIRASGGEDAAFRELFDKHYRRAVNVAYRSTGDLDAAEDIAMDAFARIYESRASFRPSAKFTTYLYKVVVNLSINAAKRRKTAASVSIEDHDVLAPGSDPSGIAERSEVSRAVRKAVLSLPENQRAALILNRYEELSYQEIAEVMGTSVRAVESLLHRAKQNLRKALGEYIELE